MVIGRFAPTPSGRMHLGNVFSALLAWLSARSQGGLILLRIEDLDLIRTKPEYTRQLIEDLLWLGLDWDNAPLPTPGADTPETVYVRNAAESNPVTALEQLPHQSQRTAFYEQQLAVLEAQGLLYPCFCSRAELHAANAPHASDGSYVYNGRCRALLPEEVAQKRLQRPPAVRIRVPKEQIDINDGCQGLYSEELSSDAGDYILRRSDGVFAYQLAAPADDGAMGVTEIVRGRDLLSSAPRQAWLMRTLGYTPPRFCHVPLLLAADGRRLSKRDQDLDIGALRQKLGAPQPVIGFLAHLAGLLPTPKPISAEELIPLFSWSKVPQEDIYADLSALL